MSTLTFRKNEGAYLHIKSVFSPKAEAQAFDDGLPGIEIPKRREEHICDGCDDYSCSTRYMKGLTYCPHGVDSFHEETDMKPEFELPALEEDPIVHRLI